MKKIIACLLAGMLLLGVGVSYAATTVTLLDKKLYDGDGDQTSDPIDTRNFKKMSFFVNYEEKEETAAQGAFYIQVSWDKSTWFDTRIKTLDSSKVDTPDTSILFTVDAKKVAFFDTELAAPWVRVKFSPTLGTADHIYITVEFIGIQ